MMTCKDSGGLLRCVVSLVSLQYKIQNKQKIAEGRTQILYNKAGATGGQVALVISQLDMPPLLACHRPIDIEGLLSLVHLGINYE